MNPARTLATGLFCLGMMAAHSWAITPTEVAWIVSTDATNQRFIDDMNIDERFDKLALPILVGSAVLPALTMVESPVFDEYVYKEEPYLPWGRILSKVDRGWERLERLGLGPFDTPPEQSNSEIYSSFTQVRIVVWPSGHILWIADTGKTPAAIKNRKGRYVEYRFAKIDFSPLRKRIEARLSPSRAPKGFYCREVWAPFGGFEYFENVFLIDVPYVARLASQLRREAPDVYYPPQGPCKRPPKGSIDMFREICETIEGARPAKGYATVTAEPEYVRKGRPAGHDESWPSETGEQPTSPAAGPTAAQTTTAQGGVFHAIAADTPSAKPSISVGDRLDDVQARLRAAKIEFTHNAFDFAYVEDQDNLRCPLDENHACAAILYSKSKGIVTGIQVYVYQSRQAGKAEQTCLFAHSIHFERDGSYRVHFAAPAKGQRAVQRSPGELPPGRMPLGEFPPSRAPGGVGGEPVFPPPMTPAPTLPPPEVP